MRKLNAKGFAHWIIPAIVVVLVGGIGTYLLTKSHADSVITGPVGQYDCGALGRVWNKSTYKCTNTCATTANGNHLITNRAYNYCSGSISFLSHKTCTSLHRVYTFYVDGCARRAQQVTVTLKNPGPAQCSYNAKTYLPYARYVAVKSGNDYCDTTYTPKPVGK